MSFMGEVSHRERVANAAIPLKVDGRQILTQVRENNECVQGLRKEFQTDVGMELQRKSVEKQCNANCRIHQQICDVVQDFFNSKMI